MKAVGPWGVKRTINYIDIKKILQNKKATVIIKHWGFFVFYIGETIDPKRIIHDLILNRIDGNQVKIINNANI